MKKQLTDCDVDIYVTDIIYTILSHPVLMMKTTMMMMMMMMIIIIIITEESLRR